MRATKILYNEYNKINKSPPGNIEVKIKEDLILEWHFLFTGLNDTPFEGGEYHGVLKFPEDYPFSPPSIRFITPNGRFKTNERLCFDLSDFHPECWRPAYTVSAVLEGVYSFMMTETTDTVGSLERDKTLIRSLAIESKDFNRKDKICNEMFHNQSTSNPGGTGSFTLNETAHTSEILTNYSDEQNDLSKSLSNNFKSQNCSSNTNSEFRPASSSSEKQMPSSGFTTYNTLDLSRKENHESSEFGEISTSKSKHRNSVVSLQNVYQSVSQQHEPSQTSSFSNKDNSNWSVKWTKRISKELQKIIDNPIDNIIVACCKDLIIEWHFLFTGLIDTPFEGGQYHGVVMFPEDYPFSPPSIRFITPNGRFKINERVCFALSDFHPENWKPAYTVSAVLQGVYSFMMTETTDTVGSLERNESEIRELAGKSGEFNLKDGSEKVFQDEINFASTEDSDAITNPLLNEKMEKTDITQSQSYYSQELLELVLSFRPKNENNLTLKITLSWPKHLKINANRMRPFYCYLEYKFSQLSTIQEFWELWKAWYEYQ